MAMPRAQNDILDFETLFDDLDAELGVALPPSRGVAAVAGHRISVPTAYGGPVRPDDGRAAEYHRPVTPSADEVNTAVSELTPPISPSDDMELGILPLLTAGPVHGADTGGNFLDDAIPDLAAQLPEPAARTSGRWQDCVDEAEVASCDTRSWLAILRAWKPAMPADEYKAMQVFRRKLRDRKHASRSRRQRQCAEDGLASEVGRLRAELAGLQAENARLRGLVAGGGSQAAAWAALPPL